MKTAEQCFKEQSINIADRKLVKETFLKKKASETLARIHDLIAEQVNSGDYMHIVTIVSPDVYDMVEQELSALGFTVTIDSSHDTHISWSLPREKPLYNNVLQKICSVS